jgi:hypothetical protein
MKPKLIWNKKNGVYRSLCYVLQPVSHSRYNVEKWTDGYCEMLSEEPLNMRKAKEQCELDLLRTPFSLM